ncbi:MAG: flagellar assembly protein FliW [Deltaproteobacteria bacterium]|nr:flagellar assembly protein FliW [Deltaproteobacteria bacterium]
MKIKTTRFGTISIEKEKTIDMPFGMLGFPDQKKFVILQHRENSPFFWYQSVDDPALAFVITSPLLFKPDYQIDLEDALKVMSWNGDGKTHGVEIYIVVNIPKGLPQKMTGNFIGPILINNKVRQAVQIVISNSPYIHNCPLVSV